MPADNFAFSNQRDRIVQRAPDGLGISLGISDDGVDSVNGLGNRLKTTQIIFDELRLEEQVLGGISDDRQFGKYDQFGSPIFSALDILDRLAAIAGDVTDGRIDLRQSDFHDNLRKMFSLPLHRTNI